MIPFIGNVCMCGGLRVTESETAGITGTCKRCGSPSPAPVWYVPQNRVQVRQVNRKERRRQAAMARRDAVH